MPVQEVQETWVGSLGQEENLEEEMATHSSFLAWGIPWTEEPGRLQSMVSQKSQICLSTTLVCRRRRNRERSRLTLPRFYQGKVI